ncbi:TPA: P-type conjugative transfer protein TrbJ [Escherichia coli]|uniref:P-type conjugative transfer protein TrbJ n=1 Tax=Enterobacteriaceae TaxID=543 RepID=UPI001286B883|nr:P-type conjugative transfer protein TrbJ [Cronobacter muytjensii]EAM5005926.1 P-type conjugative transfer protein TrbJ [Salmonella enterica]EES5376804.1 P-type conjugative transfer protein TrbJ [Escherichia coli]EAT8674933.1 P-type conjugative transfer protein TrbJ [Salmonella enterica]EEC2753738.1 P-type conjugative transfer protein TrbJ [Salmonella enterica]EES5680300.1 P-type conjugative transfer protein TrbJ [Escherichia coli]
MTNRIVLAAKKALLASFVASVMTLPAQAGIPVIDGTNVVQTTISAVNNVQAVAKQLQQYQTQLQQYENMLQNTVAPAAYVWDQANQTINKVLQAQDTLSYYKNQAGSLDSYLQRYKDINYYRTSACFNSNVSCTADEIAKLSNADKDNSEAIKRGNDAVFKAIDEQQKNLKGDALHLEQLQNQATGAKGQMEAIQAANQLASAQTNQLMQIRTLLLAQQNAATTLAQAESDKDAQRAAASAAIREGTYTKSPAKSW